MSGKLQMWNGHQLVETGPSVRTGSSLVRFHELFFSSPLSISLLALLLLPVWAAADEPTFPRGAGFYFSPFKLLLLLIVYLSWVRTCWWVDQDARHVDLPTATWNPMMFGCGFAVLLVVSMLPWFA